MRTTNSISMALTKHIKEMAVGSVGGGLAQAFRRTWHLWTSDWERRGWFANDALAEYYVTRLCLPGKVFIDGGAHIGSITAAVLRNCPHSLVVAVEAISEKADQLRRKFPRTEVVNCALAEHAGTAAFFVDLDDTAWSSMARTERRVREIEVEARMLDSFGSCGAVDIIKLDLEGAELGALKGGAGLVGRDRPIVMYESGPTDRLSYTKDAMFDWFQAIGYGIYLPSRLGKDGPPMSKEVYLDSHVYPFGTLNYFAVPLERAPEIRERVARLTKPSVWFL